MTRTKGEEDIDESKKIQDEMVGVLTAISIVTRRLANQLLELGKDPEGVQSSEKGGNVGE